MIGAYWWGRLNKDIPDLKAEPLESQIKILNQQFEHIVFSIRYQLLVYIINVDIWSFWSGIILTNLFCGISQTFVHVNWQYWQPWTFTMKLTRDMSDVCGDEHTPLHYTLGELGPKHVVTVCRQPRAHVHLVSDSLCTRFAAREDRFCGGFNTALNTCLRIDRVAALVLFDRGRGHVSCALRQVNTNNICGQITCSEHIISYSRFAHARYECMQARERTSRVCVCFAY